MSSKAKHALRSHKTYGRNQAIFGKFEQKAAKIATAKQFKKERMPFIERTKKLFKHQDR